VHSALPAYSTIAPHHEWLIDPLIQQQTLGHRPTNNNGLACPAPTPAPRRSGSRPSGCCGAGRRRCGTRRKGLVPRRARRVNGRTGQRGAVTPRTTPLGASAGPALHGEIRVGVGVQGPRQLADQPVAGVVTVFELLVLDPAQVGEAHADRRRQSHGVSFLAFCCSRTRSAKIRSLFAFCTLPGYTRSSLRTNNESLPAGRASRREAGTGAAALACAACGAGRQALS
jgi:hypothetical protein